MRTILLSLNQLGQRRRLAVVAALGLLLALWLAAAATIGEPGVSEQILVGPFRWLSHSTSA